MISVMQARLLAGGNFNSEYDIRPPYWQNSPQVPVVETFESLCFSLTNFLTFWTMSKIAMTLTSKNLILVFLVKRDRGREIGGKGAGGIREAKEEGAGSARNREKLRGIAQYFAIEISAKRRELTNIVVRNWF